MKKKINLIEITGAVGIIILATMAVILTAYAITQTDTQTKTDIGASCEICEVKHDTSALGIVYNYESGEGLCVCNLNITEPFFTLNEV